MPDHQQQYTVQSGIILQNAWARLKWDPILRQMTGFEFKLSDDVCFVRNQPPLLDEVNQWWAPAYQACPLYGLNYKSKL